jgi:hypothetical protein
LGIRRDFAESRVRAAESQTVQSDSNAAGRQTMVEEDAPFDAIGLPRSRPWSWYWYWYWYWFWIWFRLGSWFLTWWPPWCEPFMQTSNLVAGISGFQSRTLR